MPRINYILDQLREARYISSLDLKDGYWQIPLKADSRQFTAFTVPRKGLFQWRVMPFRLHSVPTAKGGKSEVKPGEVPIFQERAVVSWSSSD